MDLHSGVVYGPTLTRRFGRALGVNLAPAGRKVCNFECAYCTHGWSAAPSRSDWPGEAEIVGAVERALHTCGAIDTVLVAGSGEPTLHPAFAPIANGLVAARARYAPTAKLTLLSNSSTLDRIDVVQSLGTFDVRCMKLDAGDATTFRLMNGPTMTFGRILAELRRVSELTLVSTFVRGVTGSGGNTTPAAVRAWLDAVKHIQPKTVDVCTPAQVQQARLQPAPEETLQSIAEQVRTLGIAARVFL